MGFRTFEEVYRDLESRIVLEDGETKAIAPTIRRVAENGWKRITLKGSKDMCKTAWLEAKMYDLEVIGYNPTAKDLKELERMRHDRGGLDSLKMIDQFLACESSLRVRKKGR